MRISVERDSPFYSDVRGDVCVDGVKLFNVVGFDTRAGWAAIGYPDDSGQAWDHEHPFRYQRMNGAVTFVPRVS